MSLEEHKASTRDKLIRMANQIATFFHSKPREEGLAGTAEHINKFWEPRMRRHLFEVLDSGGEGLDELVIAASEKIRRPSDPVTPAQAAEANADVSG
ncbi:formate dehydrogenase subunit delta [Mesorhizobium sp. CGMCC 1.15528]|jgi:formate dehydrogenase subunit delta|uniref:Formate dehydrogenase subunit delta n=1 Tax=Mesorhizobium zhangyense TaxID=1776730 RepID=A0A7C9V9E3_9HYPH|nr:MULTISPECIES: formate dehydrogenase subunit delta [Mesorhizobium]NGN44145.1 formate dehydrogenase subunit delta [Mesorhizobium zhangyense]RJG46705.1 formate dehydrogenase [Mesorhizobium sp. DCY119]